MGKRGKEENTCSAKMKKRTRFGAVIDTSLG